MAVSAKELEMIRADITVGSLCMQEKTSPVMTNMAAYHFSQAIEKSVKATLNEAIKSGKIEKDEELREMMHTHNLGYLMIKAESAYPNFIQENLFIANNSRTIEKLNGLRYGEKSIPKADTFVLMKNAKQLFYNLENEYMRELGVDKTAIAEKAKEEMRELGRIYLNDEHSRWKKDKPDHNHSQKNHQHNKYAQKESGHKYTKNKRPVEIDLD